MTPDDTFAEFARANRTEFVIYAKSILRKYDDDLGGSVADAEDVCSGALLKVAQRYLTKSAEEWHKLVRRCIRNDIVDIKFRRVQGGRVRKYNNRWLPHASGVEREPLKQDSNLDGAEWAAVMSDLECPIDRTIMGALVEGYAPEDIAEQMGKCNRYVSNRIFRQRKLLREMFPEYGGN